ncbi:unnamed protein product, partial [Arabidopsis halleri]
KALFFFLCTHAPKQRAKFTRIMESCQKKKQKELETPTELSDMPDELILKIFSFLPFFKEDLATRFISEYGKGLWTPEPNVMFDDQSIDTSMSFVYGSLMSNDAQILDSLHLKLSNYYSASDINFLVQLGVNRSVRELRIDLFGKTLELPCCLSTCTTLKELVLDNLRIKSVPRWFRLPSVEILQLSSVAGGNSGASLIRIYSVHERLVVHQNTYDDVTMININVPTLRSLSIDNRKGMYGRTGGFWINAPSLMFLNIKDTFSNCIMFESMPAMIKSDIEVTHNQSEKFLESLTSIRHLSLCSPTSVTPYPTDTKFPNLEHLKLCTCSAGWQNLLACMLNDAPNLRSLTLKLRHKNDINPKSIWEKPTVVPECLSTRLEILKWRDYEGTEHEKDMVGYILANATFLQRATFSTKCRDQCDSRFSELQSMERVSEICEFVFD